MNDAADKAVDVVQKHDDAVETLPEASPEAAIVAVTAAAPPLEALAVVDPPPRRDRGRELFEAFLRGRKKSTHDAYKKDLERFAEWLGVASPVEAVRRLLTSDAGEANGLALDYRNAMIDSKLAAATVNRRLSSLKAMVQLGRMLGHVSWTIEVQGLESNPYRDTLGPGDDAIKAMLEAAADRGDTKGLRDVVILRLLRDTGLRRGEVVSLDVEHFDPKRGVSLLGKGRNEREWVTLPAVTTAAMTSWLEARGDKPGPLFVALNPGDFGHRLTGSSVYEIVKRLGLEVGVKTGPHGLRHTAITTALDRTKGDVRKVQKFSRHRDVRTLMLYDDVRSDLAGEVANLGALEDETYDEPADEDVVIACGRGHTYDEKFIGKYCCRGECKGGALKDPIRRVEKREE